MVAETDDIMKALMLNFAAPMAESANTFKSYLEEQMDLKRSCSIKFRSVEGGIAIIQAHILSMENQSGRDIIETDAGISIGLDQIIEVNERQQDNYC